jgi:hypothetical protein
MLSRRIGVLLAAGCPECEAHLWAKIGRQLEKMERKLATLNGWTDFRPEKARTLAYTAIADRLEPADMGRAMCVEENRQTLRDLREGA